MALPPLRELFSAASTACAPRMSMVPCIPVEDYRANSDPLACASAMIGAGLAPSGVRLAPGQREQNRWHLQITRSKAPLSGLNPQKWTPPIQSKALYQISRMDSPPDFLASCHSRGSRAPAKVREKRKLSRFLKDQEGRTGTIFPFPSSNKTHKKNHPGSVIEPSLGYDFQRDDATNVFTVCQRIEVRRAPRSAPAQAPPMHCFGAIA
jgi:hypothetical protein